MKDHVKNGPSKSSGEGIGRKGKERLADKPQDFENRPLGLTFDAVISCHKFINKMFGPPWQRN